MDEIVIKKHSFDLAKNRLKEFSKKKEAELEIEKVSTSGGLFGWGDHKVTGYELNRRLETIQEHFIAVNTTNNKVIKEFREIYNALDVLDKDYIMSIVANVKAIEKTSNDVRAQQGVLEKHNEKLKNQQSKLDSHQVEIEKNVANITKIVASLKVFKEKLEEFKHLTDVDKIWNGLKELEGETSKAKKELQQINSIVSDINECDHLQDVDRIWDDVEKNKSLLIDYEKRANDLATTIQKNKDELSKYIEEKADITNVAIESMSKKIKYAYLIAGGSVGIAIIELVLLFMKVL